MSETAIGGLLLPFAVGLGFAYCAAPGAVNAESLRRGLAHGPRAAFVMQLGSIVGDMIWAVLALAGVTFLLQDERLRALLGLGGGMLLLWFAWGALRAAWRPHPSGEPPAHTAAGAFAAGVAMATANPWGPVFWLGIGAGVAAGGGFEALPFLVSFFAGTVVWALVVAGVIALARRLPVERVFRAVDLVAGLAFAWFALSLLATTLAILRG